MVVALAFRIHAAALRIVARIGALVLRAHLVAVALKVQCACH